MEYYKLKTSPCHNLKKLLIQFLKQFTKYYMPRMSPGTERLFSSAGEVLALILNYLAAPEALTHTQGELDIRCLQLEVLLLLICFP